MIKKFVPLSVPNLKGNEKKYVIDAIDKEWVSTAGSYVDKFELDMAEYVSSKGAVSCQNGTAGLHIALKLLGVDKECEVIAPALTFIAAINPIKYLQAEPIFLDCDETLCLDPQKLEQFCEKECYIEDEKLFNKKTKKQIKAIVVVHVFGNLAKIEQIIKIAKKYNIKVLEDATEALGTKDKNDKFAGTFADVGVYSFNGNKIITTGGGGMIVSNDSELLKKAKHLTTQAKVDDLFFEHDEIGFNYRMTNIQAAIGVAQLEQLEEFIDVKKNNFIKYKKSLSDIKGLNLIDFREDIRPNYWFYSIYVDEKNYGISRNDLIDLLQRNKIQSRPVWKLINEQIPYSNNQTYAIEKAKDFCEHIINIPCSSNLKIEEIDYILSVLKNKK